jgi:DNA mismatch repair protein MutS
MRQYLDVKDRYPDALVFFRLGDFYEMFFEDAVLAARLLDLTLTSRDKGKDDAIPMCGVPHHAVRGYLAKLTELGHKVVICEQTEDARAAKGLVKREVVRVVTPGVVLDDDLLDPKQPRYLAAIALGKKGAATGAPGAQQTCGLAYLDVTTGEARATELALTAVVDELVRVAPREVLVGDASKLGGLRARHAGIAWNVARVPDVAGAREVLGALAEGLTSELALRAAATVVAYARETQPMGALPLTRVASYALDDAVLLDEAAIRNLEVVETLIGRERKGSLLDVVDQTVTGPGARLLRRWLVYPLRDVAQIRRRQDAVAWLVTRPALRGELRQALSHVADLERLAGKATLGVATPRDVARLRDALGGLPALVEVVRSGASTIDPVPELLDLRAAAAPALAQIAARLASALVDEPPALIKDGGTIRPGHDATIDECRRLADGGKDEILAIEAREQKDSGIPSLKVRYNRVFGYYIEITKTHLAKVPASYVRKQTIATGERFVTAELAELERKVLAAEDTLATREAELFRLEVEAVAAVAREISAAGAALAVADACASLADVAARRDYCRPTVDDGLVIEIVDGRHPVIEAMLADGAFVPNDCRLDPDAEQLVLITGPNMAGKSTYMRQLAHIVLLAQIGAFVPARSARIGACDRVFTRVGAADNLSRGESTFMVEMRETAAILAKATRRSLVVLDEVGRGTSTFDGISIAWAVAEHLHDAIGARTLFATHYHELVELAAGRPRVRNVHAAARHDDAKREIVFLRRIVPGGADRSYGIDVARLAGLPTGVIGRARVVMSELEAGALERRVAVSPQLPLLAAPQPSPLVSRLAAIDPNRMTPLEALQLLVELKSLV